MTTTMQRPCLESSWLPYRPIAKVSSVPFIGEYPPNGASGSTGERDAGYRQRRICGGHTSAILCQWYRLRHRATKLMAGSSTLVEMQNPNTHHHNPSNHTHGKLRRGFSHRHMSTTRECFPYSHGHECYGSPTLQLAPSPFKPKR